MIRGVWRTIALGLVVMMRVASADGSGSAGSGSAGSNGQRVEAPETSRHGLGIIFVAVSVLGLLVLSKYLPSTKTQGPKQPPPGDDA
jgi:hypothetical protein